MKKGADQTARMCRLVCACVVCKPPETGVCAARPKYKHMLVDLVSFIEGKVVMMITKCDILYYRCAIHELPV